MKIKLHPISYLYLLLGAVGVPVSFHGKTITEIDGEEITATRCAWFGRIDRVTKFNSSEIRDYEILYSSGGRRGGPSYSVSCILKNKDKVYITRFGSGEKAQAFTTSLKEGISQKSFYDSRYPGIGGLKICAICFALTIGGAIFETRRAKAYDKWLGENFKNLPKL